MVGEARLWRRAAAFAALVTGEMPLGAADVVPRPAGEPIAASDGALRGALDGCIDDDATLDELASMAGLSSDSFYI